MIELFKVKLSFKLEETMKKLISIISFAFICVFMTSLVGCGNNSTGDSSDKTFSFSNYGFEITLTNQFKEKTYLDYTVYLESDDVTFVGIKETFRTLKTTINNTDAKQISVMDYANQSISKFSLSATPTTFNVTSVFYSFNKSNKTYYVYVSKGGKGFWTCQFAFDSSKEDQLKSTIEKYAKSIKDLDEAIVEKDFDNTELGFKITLSSDFENKTTSGYDISIANTDVMFTAKKFSFDSIVADDPTFKIDTASPNDFAKYWITKEQLAESQQLEKPKLDTTNNWSKFVYTEKITTQSLNYYCYAFKSAESNLFWICRFSCEEENAATYSADFDGYAKTIKFN